MSKIKLYNGCAGLGANVKLLDTDYYDITSVEMFDKIANTNKVINPKHNILTNDAFQYFQDNHKKFSAAWFSPNCQSHSRMVKATRHNVNKIPDMTGLYGIITFLQHFYAGNWIVENVVPFYKPLIKPKLQVGRHLFWSNVDLEPVDDVSRPKDFINLSTVAGSEKLKKWLGLEYDGNVYYKGNHCPSQVLRNCVHPLIGKQLIEQIA